MKEYYRNRANEYDKIYQTPEWQSDLGDLEAWIKGFTWNQSVLEVAAGTGYWTEVTAKTAKEITATDASAAMLANAAARRLGAHVVLREADAYDLPESFSGFDVGAAHLWWSHVPIQRQKEFLLHLSSRLRHGGTLLMTDQVYREGYSPPAHRRDRAGNRYELRSLENGEIYQIIKNYPTSAELAQAFLCVSDEIEIGFLDYFWHLRARLRGA